MLVAEPHLATGRNERLPATSGSDCYQKLISPVAEQRDERQGEVEQEERHTAPSS